MKAQTQSVEKATLSRIYGHRRGWVFTPKEFLKLGNRTDVDVALHGLVKRGVIRRLAHGLYDYPKFSTLVGELPPTPEAIAKAVAGSENLRLQPAGEYAANLLGLSEQVPARVTYFTDGPNRTFRVGNQTLVFKRTTPRNMALHNRISGLVVQALRYLGKEHVGASQIEVLRVRLTDEQKQQLCTDAQWAPSWVATVMRKISQDDQP